ncbi:hypothetical protein LX32DRAFT_21388 [Colletotrichum zoysiae]|uniref:Uncharacterized protein n=1 Tax=Colletotrichum zoysiae TaxID=1216348 RepID=A0AAD9LZ93_9PEZI|nr:hypothetical protein LX32DRAFT_21388 [Colletotrichum zoysiae]
MQVVVKWVDASRRRAHGLRDGLIQDDDKHGWMGWGRWEGSVRLFLLLLLLFLLWSPVVNGRRRQSQGRVRSGEVR